MKKGSREWRKRLRDDPDFRKRYEPQLAKELVEAILSAAVAHGQIKVAGKSDIEIWQDVLKLLEDKRDTGGRWLFAIDHTGTLRDVARQMGLAGRDQIQALLLATWVEHVANELVALGALRKRLDDKVVTTIIRDTSLRARLSWLPELLGFPRLPTLHFDALMRLTDWRNQFVHYKWKYSESHQDIEDVQRTIAETSKAIRYLAHYRSRQICGGDKRHVKRLSRGSHKVR